MTVNILTACLALLLFVAPVCAQTPTPTYPPSTDTGCTDGVVSGSSPSVTAKCHVYWSAFSSPLLGQGQLVYDLWYLTSDGLSNTNPDVVFAHGGALSATDFDLTNGAGGFSDSPFTHLAQHHLNVYSFGYSYVGAAKLHANISAGATSLVYDIQNGNAYFPTGTPPTYQITIDAETVNVVSQSGTTLTVSATASAHTLGAIIFVVGDAWSMPASDAACFLGFLGHNNGVIAGDPTDVRLYGTSSGGHLSLMQALIAPAMLDASRCEFTTADIAVTKVTRVMASAGPPIDLGCMTVDGFAVFSAAAIAGVAPISADSITSTCAATNPNANYLIAQGISPSWCLPKHSIACTYPTPTTPSVKAVLRMQTGNNDLTVGTKSAAELLSVWPRSTQYMLANGCPGGLTSQTTCVEVAVNRDGHTLDDYQSPCASGHMCQSSLAVLDVEAFLEATPTPTPVMRKRALGT